jgi:citrate synthase
MPDTLSVTDNRNGKTYELKIENGCVRALDLRTIKSGPDDFGLMTYDPAFLNTANCKSAITFIDGDKGILRIPRLPDRGAGRKVEPSSKSARMLRTASCPTSRSMTELREVT